MKTIRIPGFGVAIVGLALAVALLRNQFGGHPVHRASERERQ